MVAQARILIVEDDAIVARDLKASLTKMGYFVTGVAAAGEEALEMAGENRPDLVLMDIMFDGDIDGIETAQRMRNEHDVPVIYLTGYGDQATFERAKQTLPLAFVLKPFDPKELYLTIETSLERRRLETDLERAEQRLAALVGVVRDGIVVTDAQGRIASVNQVAESLSGFPSSELQGTELNELLAPVDGAAAARRATSVDKVMNRAAELRTNGGPKRRVVYDSVPVVDRKGNVRGVVVAFRP
jgi:PAS domain S-box-containing protein